jgi:hypothetical protein
MAFIMDKYTDPPFPKKFPENFIVSIVPPKPPVRMSYRGGYGRGDPHHGGHAVLQGGVIVWITYIPLPMCHSVMLITYLTPHQPRHTLPKVIFITNKHIDFFITINMVGD